MLHYIKRLSNRSADFLGISASFLCMIHCLAIPVLVSMGYFLHSGTQHNHAHGMGVFHYWGHQDHNHEHGGFHFHWHSMDYIFVILALVAVYHAAKNTQSKEIKIGLWTAVSIFSIAILLHEWNAWMIWVSLSASIALIIIHILNWNYHKKCKIKDF